ncbi:MAG: hypothetical protein JWR50_3651 [Mucilaginibacter sp.]|nr:hypothetical protein [Mucilaginibacter sp.]
MIRQMKKIYILFVLLLGIGKTYAQQTLQLSQYIFNGLAVNPAYAGYKDNWTINLGSRLQWQGVNGAPVTNTLSVDGIADSENKNIGLGLLVMNDRLGPENNSSVYANYAYRIKLNNDDSQRLCFGIAAGIVQYSIDESLFNPTDANDPSLSTGVQNKISTDFRFGIYYYSPVFYVGGSLLNLIPDDRPDPNSIFVKNVRSLYVTSGFIIPISPQVNWKPSVLFKEDFKGPTNLNAGSYFLISDLLWVGASYSTAVTIWKKSNLQTDLNKTDALTAAVAINISPLCRFGYSYDIGGGKVAGYPAASHEISFSLGFGRKKGRILSPRYF